MSETATTGERAILVVEPPVTDREFTGRILREDGYRVVAVGRYSDALDRIGEESFSLIVADLATPELDLARLRERAGAPVLLLTDHLSMEAVSTQRSAGAADVLQKPLDGHRLLVKVRDVLRTSGEAAAETYMPARALTGEQDEFREQIPDILYSIPAWLLVVDAGLRVRFANRSLLRFLGRSFTEIAGNPVEEVLAPRLIGGDEAVRTIRGVLEEGGRRVLPSIRFVTPAGEERATDLQATSLELGTGPHVLVILHDVSEYLWSREALRLEKRKLDEIVNGMGAALAVLGPDLTVRWTNRMFETWFGEAWGRKFHLALRGLMLVGDVDPARVFVPGRHVSKEWAHIDGSGNRRYFRNVVFPSHDVEGHLQELLLVTQDLTEVTLRAEQHRLVHELADLLQSTLELDRLLYIILTCVTAGHALGFNRAFLFLADPGETSLVGRMGVGPSSREEAFTIWADLAASRRSLADLTMDYDRFSSREPGPLTHLVEDLRFPLDGPGADDAIPARAAREGKLQIVRDAETDPRVSPEFRERFGANEFACSPLQSKGRVVGVLMVDNIFSDRRIGEEQADMLTLFSAPAGLALANARNYAELKKSLEQLTEAQERVIQAERLATVGRLAAHVAHEIRNPLVTIGGFAAAIRKRSGDEAAVRRAADIIYDEVIRLEEILSGVMDFSRPGSVSPQPEDVNDLIRRLVDPLREELELKGIDLRLEPGDVPPCRVDRKAFHQALLNLVRNSIDSLVAPEQGDRPRWIRIATRLDADEVVIEIEDDGAGIPEELEPELFEPFVSGKAGGTGLGLAVVRKIVLDHGGTIAATNRDGAVFTLRLPAS